ncbi:MAG: hydantoinase/carbamoylase family amidase, partial [Rhodomicrobium sp.]
MHSLSADGATLWERLTTLARHGGRANGGVDRQALSDAEITARAKIVAWGRAAGLVPFTDDATNLFLRLEGTNPDLPPVLAGSHIDTQPTGGKFDGALGVLVALEALESIKSAGVLPKRPIEAVAWMNEEGSRFAPGMMGSAVYTGARKLLDIMGIRDLSGKNVGEEIERVLGADCGISKRTLQRPIAAYLEVHIEQGPILEREKKTIGIVSGIQGKRTFRVTVTGQEDHAGTSPRAMRRDALAAAVRIISAMQDAFWDDADAVRFTVGQLLVEPNVPSVVPAKANFSVDLRHPVAEELTRLGDFVEPIAQANCGPCDVQVQQFLHDPPLTFPQDIRETIAEITNELGYDAMEIASGAGHDARYLHYFCPTGMIFIPCKEGISHHPSESIEPAHATAC